MAGLGSLRAHHAYRLPSPFAVITMCTFLRSPLKTSAGTSPSRKSYNGGRLLYPVNYELTPKVFRLFGYQKLPRCTFYINLMR